jgi:hypothetical protein
MEIFIGVTSFLIGVFSMLFYILSRMMRSDGWDDSNITNALRLLSHVTLHPEDFGKMWYCEIDEQGFPILGHRPFWYVDKDELSEVVKTRP